MAEELNMDYELYEYILANVFVSFGCLNPFTEMYKTLCQFNFCLENTI